MAAINSEFVITEHHAKRAGLHWDLRFQIPKSDMWASFAVRKGVPLKPGTKVLAVRTHDHKRDEALLTGTIKDGYGAGKFKEWDRGKCIIYKYGISHMAIEFKGKKVKGIYHLINMGVSNKQFDEQQYWLFKGKIVKESSGMASRVPTGGIKVDTEEGQSEESGTKLPWSHCDADGHVKESSGMKSRVPTGGSKEDTEEGQSEEVGTKLPWSPCDPHQGHVKENYPDGPGLGMCSRNPPGDTSEVEMSDEEADAQQTEKLPWSISEGVKTMKDYAMIATYTAMKGFFKKRPAGEYLLVGLKDVKNNTFILVQFFDMLKPDMYICAIVGGAQSPDDDVLEENFDQLRYAADVKILEDKLPLKIQFGSGIKLTFTKPSKYVGKTIELLKDSRLPSGYYIAKCKMKKGFEPAVQYKVGPQAAGTTPLNMDAFDTGNLDTMKQMRAFTTARMDKILKTKK